MRARTIIGLVALLAPLTAAVPASAAGSPAGRAPFQAAGATVADAAMRGDLEAVRALLLNGADVNVPQNDGMTALHWAALRDDAALADMLAYAGAWLDVGTRLGGYTPLHLAAREGNQEVIAALLRAGADPEAATTSGGARSLHFAAAAGSVESIELLIEAGAAVDGTDSAWQQTPLMFAAAANRVDAVRALLRHDADFGASARVMDVVARAEADREETRRRSRQRAALRALEEEEEKGESEGGEGGGEEEEEGQQGEEPEKAAGGEEAEQGEQGEGPEKAEGGEKAREGEKGAAAEQEKPAEGAKPDQVAKPVEEAKAGEEAKPVEGTNPEDKAGPDEAEKAAAGEEAAESEAEKPEGEEGEGEEDDDEADEEEEMRPPSYADLVGGHGGLTPLLYAAREGHVETVRALLEAGADINQPSDGDGTSPLLIATLNGHFDLAMMLLERGADPALASAAGATPLYGALNVRWAPRSAYPQQNAYKQQETGYLELMTALLEAGADPNVRLTKHLWYTSFNFDHLLDSTGATPFWRAAYATDVDAMRLLVAHGADPNMPTRKLPSRGRPRPQGEDGKETEELDPSGLPEVPVGGPAVYPIHAASGAGYGEGFAGYAHQHVPEGWLPAVRYLVEELGADVNARDHNGYNPVHHAAARGDFEMILYLVSRGADPTAVSRKGQTTADMANGPVQRIQPFPRAVWLLERLGSKNNDNCVSC